MLTRNYNVVGVTFEGRQAILSNFFDSYHHGKKYSISLEREPDNTYDHNAIAVNLDVGDGDYKKVGYISKDDNAELCTDMDNIETSFLHSIGPNSKGVIGLTITVQFGE